MNFGVRLPGPFRVGISDKGRVTAGMTLGPVSLSTGVGGAPQRGGPALFPGELADLAEALREQGWSVLPAGGPWSATKGWRELRLEPTPEGVLVHAVTSRRKLWLWAAIAAAVIVVATIQGW